MRVILGGQRRPTLSRRVLTRTARAVRL